MLCFNIHACSIIKFNNYKNPKTLVLIIACDNEPRYIKLQEIWRAYMHSDPEHFEAYFIKADPCLPTEYKIDNDVIWSKSVENIRPGILNKTILSLKCMLPRIKAGEFDYILRTNSSSFFIYSNLLEHLKKCPTIKFYSGLDIGLGHNICSGSGFLISSDLAELLVSNSSNLINSSDTFDDVTIGLFFKAKKIKAVIRDYISILNLNDFKNKINKITVNDFHFRIKNERIDLQMIDDFYVYAQLLKKYYHVDYLK